MAVDIKEIPPYRIAYMRHVGPYGEGGQIGALWTSFERWIRARDLRHPDTVTIGIGHDAPRIASPDKLRYDACVVVGENFKADRLVNVTHLPGGKYAVTHFEGASAGLSGAWDTFFTAWLPGSGYQPEDRPCLELYRNDPQRLPDHLRCDLCIPIRPL